MAHALTLALSPPVPSPSVQTTSPFRGIVGTTIKTFKPPLTLDLHGRILFTKNAHETLKPFCCPQSLLRELCGLDIFSFCRDFQRLLPQHGRTVNVGTEPGGGEASFRCLGLCFFTRASALARIPCASYTISPLRPSNNSQIKCLLENTSVYKLPRKSLQAQELCGISHTQNK